MPLKKILFLLLFIPQYFHAGGVFPFSDLAVAERPYPTNPTYSGGEEHFNAIYDGKKVLLTWKSGIRKSFDYYTIEKSKDGLHFTTALIIKGSGNSAAENIFNDVDFAPFSGLSYYRLKQTDYQGHVVYSSVIPVNFQYAKDGSIVAAGNALPSEIDLQKIAGKEVLVLVRDGSGNEFTAKVKVSMAADQKLYAMEPNHLLSKGSYIVLASSANTLYSQKIIVQ